MPVNPSHLRPGDRNGTAACGNRPRHRLANASHAAQFSQKMPGRVSQRDIPAQRLIRLEPSGLQDLPAVRLNFQAGRRLRHEKARGESPRRRAGRYPVRDVVDAPNRQFPVSPEADLAKPDPTANQPVALAKRGAPRLPAAVHRQQQPGLFECLANGRHPVGQPVPPKRQQTAGAMIVEPDAAAVKPPVAVLLIQHAARENPRPAECGFCFCAGASAPPVRRDRGEAA